MSVEEPVTVTAEKVTITREEVFEIPFSLNLGPDRVVAGRVEVKALPDGRIGGAGGNWWVATREGDERRTVWDMSELADVTLADFLRQALIGANVEHQLGVDPITARATLPPEVVREALDRASEQVAAHTRRYRVTPELLAEIRRLHDEGGIPLIVKKTGRTERTARRLWARAQAEQGS